MKGQPYVCHTMTVSSPVEESRRRRWRRWRRWRRGGDARPLGCCHRFEVICPTVEGRPSIVAHSNVCFTRAGDVGLVLWHGEATLAANRWLSHLVTSARRSGDGIRIGVQLLADRTGLPDAETRRYVQQVYAEELPHIRRFINAPLGDSLKQSLMRTVMRGMTMIGDKSRITFVASTIDEALDLVAPVASADTPPRSVLSRGIDQLFAEAKLARTG